MNMLISSLPHPWIHLYNYRKVIVEKLCLNFAEAFRLQRNYLDEQDDSIVFRLKGKNIDSKDFESAKKIAADYLGGNNGL